MSLQFDVKKSFPSLYAPKNVEFALVDVPRMRYLGISGVGAPESHSFAEAIEALYSTAYPVKFISKAATGNDYVIPPLEGLWWAQDPTAFVENRRDSWNWTLLSYLPEWVSDEHVHAAITKAVSKGKVLAQQVQILELTEGNSYQALYIGSFAEEGPILDNLHHTVMPQTNYTFNGPHHEIYLSDFRKTEPSKLRTILRQPVKSLNKSN